MNEMNREDGLAIEPSDRDELVELVAGQLRQKFEQEPAVDDDGDFVLSHLGQPVWVRLQEGQPVIEIFACVARGVYSRRAAAIELGILNRDCFWSRWTLRDRDIWQQIYLPAMPFVPQHFDKLLDSFFMSMSRHRDDLALRLRARAA